MDWVLQLFSKDTNEIKFYNAIKKTKIIILNTNIIGDTLSEAIEKIGSIVISPHAHFSQMEVRAGG